MLEAPGCGSPEPLVFPRHRPSRSAQSQSQILLFYSFLVLMFSMLDSPSRTGRPTWKRTRGRLPRPARLAKTRCETSGYNTGPGRCSDPSCLVLQPEGRRSAAEPSPPPLDSVKTTQRPKEGPTRARGGCGAWRVGGSGEPAAQPLGARAVSVQSSASALVRLSGRARSTPNPSPRQF